MVKVNKLSFGSIKNVYFVGIGGIGMSAIAQILHNLGFQVSGSDSIGSTNIKVLKQLGIKVYLGHQKSNIKDAQVVVTSNAISPANVEVLYAKEKNIPVIHRGEMLAELMRLKFGIAISGTHGKTTTTAMLSFVCIEAGLNPTSVIGGRWTTIQSNAQLGKGELLICEADESDGSFLKLSPTMSIVTNIDKDHMDFYKTEENLLSHFLEFIHKTPFYGKSIICMDSNYAKRILPEIQKPYTTYGIKSDADFIAKNIQCNEEKMIFDVYQYMAQKSDYQFVDNFSLNVLGEHNIKNALSVICMSIELGISINVIKKALANFKGVDRRMSYLGRYKHYTIIDDYAHHSTEIIATIKALKYLYEKIIVVFQPHRYSRTLDQYKELSNAFDEANELYLTQIYSSDESPIKGVTTALIYDRIIKKLKTNSNKINLKKVYYCDTINELEKEICNDLEKENKQPKTVIITMGAGDIYTLGKNLIAYKH